MCGLNSANNRLYLLLFTFEFTAAKNDSDIDAKVILLLLKLLVVECCAEMMRDLEADTRHYAETTEFVDILDVRDVLEVVDEHTISDTDAGKQRKTFGSPNVQIGNSQTCD